MSRSGSRVVIRLALDPYCWRNDYRSEWAALLIAAAESAAPHVISIESYDMGDTLMHIYMHSFEEPTKLRKLFRDDLGLKRLWARFGDLDARPELEIERE
jgi:hypothetical protein